MRGLLELLLGGRWGSDLFVECRNCGTTLSNPRDACPECESESIATYEIG